MGARLAWSNLLTAAGVVITSSSEATGHPDENLSHPSRWKDWRSASATTDQWVKFDLGAAKSFQVLAVMNAILHTGGSLKVQANATDIWTSPTINDTLTVPNPDFTQVLADWFGTVQSFRWIRFLFVNTGAVNEAVQLGAVFAGTYLEPARSVSPDLMVRRVDPSVKRYATGGQRSSVLRAKYHEVSGTFVLQTASARNDLRTLYETAGSTTSVLFALDPANPSLVFYGSLQPALAATHRGPDLWDLPIDFVEDVA